MNDSIDCGGVAVFVLLGAQRNGVGALNGYPLAVACVPVSKKGTAGAGQSTSSQMRFILQSQQAPTGNILVAVGLNPKLEWSNDLGVHICSQVQRALRLPADLVPLPTVVCDVGHVMAEIDSALGIAGQNPLEILHGVGFNNFSRGATLLQASMPFTLAVANSAVCVRLTGRLDKAIMNVSPQKSIYHCEKQRKPIPATQLVTYSFSCGSNALEPMLADAEASGVVFGCPICHRKAPSQDVATFTAHLLLVHGVIANARVAAEDGEVEMAMTAASSGRDRIEPAEDLVMDTKNIFSDWFCDVHPMPSFSKSDELGGDEDCFDFRKDPAFSAALSLRKRKLLPQSDGQDRSSVVAPQIILPIVSSSELTPVNKETGACHPASVATAAVQQVTSANPPVNVDSKHTKAFPRQYFHSQTGQPVLDNELDIDSDDEADDAWLVDQSTRLIRSFVDISETDKEVMIMWNAFLRERKVFADFLVAETCTEFARKHGKSMATKDMRMSFMKHLCLLWDHALLDLSTMLTCLELVDSAHIVANH